MLNHSHLHPIAFPKKDCTGRSLTWEYSCLTSQTQGQRSKTYYKFGTYLSYFSLNPLFTPSAHFLGARTILKAHQHLFPFRHWVPISDAG